MNRARAGLIALPVCLLVALLATAGIAPAAQPAVVVDVPGAAAPVAPAIQAPKSNTSVAAATPPAELTRVSAPLIDASLADQGIVTVSYAPEAGHKYKVTVEKAGVQIPYNFNGTASFPLQLGSGAYSVKLLENIEGTRYNVVLSSDFEAKIADANAVYLKSMQLADWTGAPAAVAKAKALTAGLKDDNAKVKAVYDYVLANIKFDDAKLSKLTSDYIPSAQVTWTSGSGICYDFSTLFAAMLRSVGIPAKLVKGYTPNANGYHAWNEVYLADSQQWVIIDTSYDAQLLRAKLPMTMIKKASDYTKVREY